MAICQNTWQITINHLIWFNLPLTISFELRNIKVGPTRRLYKPVINMKHESSD